MKTTEHCIGCYNNHYNQPGNSTNGKCWHLAAAKMITRFELGVHTPMNIREAYLKVKKPSCYRRTGYVFLEAIPYYAQSRKERDEERARESRRVEQSLASAQL